MYKQDIILIQHTLYIWLVWQVSCVASRGEL